MFGIIPINLISKENKPLHFCFEQKCTKKYTEVLKFQDELIENCDLRLVDVTLCLFGDWINLNETRYLSKKHPWSNSLFEEMNNKMYT